jgi:hypothetical protein
MNPPTPSANTCPICGQPNQCAMALGQPAETCWCWGAKISQDILKRIPAKERGTACICPKCAGLEANATPRAQLAG